MNIISEQKAYKQKRIFLQKERKFQVHQLRNTPKSDWNVAFQEKFDEIWQRKNLFLM